MAQIEYWFEKILPNGSKETTRKWIQFILLLAAVVIGWYNIYMGNANNIEILLVKNQNLTLIYKQDSLANKWNIKLNEISTHDLMHDSISGFLMRKNEEEHKVFSEQIRAINTKLSAR